MANLPRVVGEQKYPLTHMGLAHVNAFQTAGLTPFSALANGGSDPL